MVTEEIRYLYHDEKPFSLQLIHPDIKGPLPLVIDLHGGCWSKGSKAECLSRDLVLAEAGVASAALDFRQGASGYPNSLIDINYAIRWLKANADELNILPEKIGIIGQSSGGHLAMLSAMRPHDPRYASLRLEHYPDIDATVNCVGMLWPVINPLSRYKRICFLRTQINTPAWVGDLPERHNLYWASELEMAEGNPLLAIESGERVYTPPTIWIQGKPDPVHDYHDPESPYELNEPERFALNYREAGGSIKILNINQKERTTRKSLDPLVKFLQNNLADKKYE